MAVHSPLAQFTIKPLMPLEIAGYNVAFTQSAAWMLVAVVCATLLMTLSVRSKALVPGRWQNVSEMLYELVFGIVKGNLHGEAKKYFPLIFSLFMIVLMGNLLGMIPYSFTFTSHIIVTATLALFVFIFATLLGIYKHGLHFFSFFLPAGIPWWLAPFIVIIEVISYLSRPLSLSVRLFANMTAGHTMLKVFAGFSVMLIAVTAGAFLSILPLVINVALVGLELMIAFIQAYVFAVLSCMYLKDAIELH